MGTQGDLKITSARLLRVDEHETYSGQIMTEGTWWVDSTTGGHIAQVAAGIGLAAATSLKQIVGTPYSFMGYVCPAVVLENNFALSKGTKLCPGDRFFLEDYSFTVLNDNIAICDTVIGRSQYSASGFDGDYSKSDVKTYIDKWFERLDKEVRRDKPKTEAVTVTIEDVLSTQSMVEIALSENPCNPERVLEANRGLEPIPYKLWMYFAMQPNYTRQSITADVAREQLGFHREAYLLGMRSLIRLGVLEYTGRTDEQGQKIWRFEGRIPDGLAQVEGTITSRTRAPVGETSI